MRKKISMHRFKVERPNFTVSAFSFSIYWSNVAVRWVSWVAAAANKYVMEFFNQDSRKKWRHLVVVVLVRLPRLEASVSGCRGASQDAASGWLRPLDKKYCFSIKSFVISPAGKLDNFRSTKTKYILHAIYAEYHMSSIL
jgi:hypothetical protein